MDSLTLEDLVITCPECQEEPADDGSVFHAKAYPKNCESCEGRGRVLTANGKVLWEFMKIMNQPTHPE